MKKIIILLLVLINSICFKAQSPLDTTNLNGIWLYNATNASQSSLNNLSLLPYKVKGAGIYIYWKDLQPTQSSFNWSVLDNALTKVKNANIKANLMIWVGPSAPFWIYNSVDSVKTNDVDNTFYLNRYPYYFDPQYKPLFFKMLDSVIIHCGNLPIAIKENIKVFQSAQGTTGDLTWYKGAPTNMPTNTVNCNCTNYLINDVSWITNMIQPEWKRTDSMLAIYLPKTNHIVNAGTDKIVNNPAYLNNYIWSRSKFPYLWYKANNMAHWYQMNDEPNSKKVFDSILNQPYNGMCYPKIRTRDEFDLAGNTAENFSPNWHLYFTAANALHFGVDMWNIFSTDVSLPDNFEGLQFFSKYAGVKNATCSPAAFSILRDGLDANDFTRFTSGSYGSGTSGLTDVAGKQRCVNIANSYSVFGSSQDAPTSGQAGSFNQVTATALNDVGWNIYTGNYERYLKQWNPNSTSVGYWRQGDTLQPYGRFARGFNHASGKDTMFFNIDDSFFSSFPNNANQTVTVNITYLDKGTGTWKLEYDAIGITGSVNVAFTHTNTNTTNSIVPINAFRNQNYVWKSISTVITDGMFANNCGHGSDFRIVNTDATDEIFHKIEIIKGASSVGLKEYNAQNNLIVVYPNPTNSIVNFDGNFETWTLTTVFGQHLSSGNSKSVSLENYKPGIYFISFSNKNNITVVKKIIKE